MPQRNNEKKKVALILGSGFSANVGVPTANNLPSTLILTPRNSWIALELDELINQALRKYWEDIFGYNVSREQPSLEDHFTVLDIAANSGHNLGTNYGPNELRAIRRFSIHRVFQILNTTDGECDEISKLFVTMKDNYDFFIATLNWDIVAEKHLFSRGIRWDYVIDTYNFSSLVGKLNQRGEDDIAAFKLHGSSNWVYCDCCRRIFTPPSNDAQIKTALLINAYLQRKDFEHFAKLYNKTISSEAMKEISEHQKCITCGGPLSGRLATFSFRKDFSPAFLQTVWDTAYRYLQDANTWLFIGYSLPEADFEFRHLLKSAQFARKNPNDWQCEVIIKDDREAANRYERFFGIDSSQIFQCGLSQWVTERLESF